MKEPINWDRVTIGVLLGLYLLICYAALGADKGRQAFLDNCSQCHGLTAHGEGPAGTYMSPKPRDLVQEPFKYGETEEAIIHTITDGISRTAMPSFQSLSDEDKTAIVQYILRLRKVYKERREH